MIPPLRLAGYLDEACVPLVGSFIWNAGPHAVTRDHLPPAAEGLSIPDFRDAEFQRVDFRVTALRLCG
jgi:hypothetical protein